MDTVYIQELKADAVIGVRAWERRVRQTLVLDLELGADVPAAAAADAVADALDYDAVSRHVVAWVRDSDYHLVETLAESLAAELQQQFAIPWLRLQIAKPGAVPGARAVGVRLERGRSPGA